MLLSLDSSGQKYVSHMDEVEAFMSRREVPPELRHRIRSYMRFRYPPVSALYDAVPSSGLQAKIDSLPKHCMLMYYGDKRSWKISCGVRRYSIHALTVPSNRRARREKRILLSSEQTPNKQVIYYLQDNACS